MKRLLALMLCAVSLGVGATTPEGYWISIEEYAVHDAGELAGLTTYRVYLNCANETDFLYACVGDDDHPLIVNSTSGTWYNNGLSTSWNAIDLNPAFFSFFPDLQYDSFVTIGSDNSTGIHPAAAIGDIDWRQAFLGSGGSDATYGSNLIVNDEVGGGWFRTFPGLAEAETDPAFAGDDLRVLVMQITTAGTLFGQILCGVFVEGSTNAESEELMLLPLGGCDCAEDDDADCICDDLDDCVGELDACGVCNGPGEIYECGCADIPEGECDCDGNVLDECGICGGTGIQQGACDCEGNVLDVVGVCGGDCISDVNNNGVCDLEELENTSGEEFCGQGTIWDDASQTCIPDNPSDLNYDGCVDVNDFMGHLAAFGSGCEEGVAETPWQCGDALEYQGYDYQTVQIGDQCWFAENLRSENYEGGDAIASNLADPEWSATTLGATAVYGEGSSQCFTESPDGDACNEYWALEEYGRLYNWYAVDDGRGLCPSGWDVPSIENWNTVIAFLGGETDAGYKMKSTFGWLENGHGTNASGFMALPGGYMDFDVWGSSTIFYDAGMLGGWWSSTPNGGQQAWHTEIVHDSNGMSTFFYRDRNSGWSVRCIKDSE